MGMSFGIQTIGEYKMMSIEIPVVKCKICGFTTSKCEIEARHELTETIKALDVSDKCKEVLQAIEEFTMIYTDEVEALFPMVIKAIDGKDMKFNWIGCMELVARQNRQNVKEMPEN